MFIVIDKTTIIDDSMTPLNLIFSIFSFDRRALNALSQQQATTLPLRIVTTAATGLLSLPPQPHSYP
jgi:hypothetical protein